MTQIQIVPVFIPTGNNAPLTEEDGKIMTGIWIILNLIWIISFIFSIIIYYTRKIKWKKEGAYGGISFGRWENDNGSGFIFWILDGLMGIIWILLLLFLAGEYISKFL